MVTDRTVTWTTSDPRVALVSSSGLVTAVGVGSASITASSEGKSGSASVTVAPVPVANVAVSPSSGAVTIGSTIQLTAQVTDASGNTLSDRAVTWSSSDPGVATVSATGLVTGVNQGTTTITATGEGQSGSAAISVNPVPVASVDVSPAQSSLQVGQTRQLTATPKDAGGNALTGRTVTWESSNAGVATVSSTGVVTGVSAGSATITATSEGKSGSASVTVSPVPVASVTVTPPSSALVVGSTAQLSAEVKDASGNTLGDRPVSWTSGDPSVATVSGTGLVTALKAGTTSITASSEGRSGSASVSVSPAPVASVDVAPSTASLQVGQTRQLTATARDASGNVLPGRTVTWQSSNTGVATVSSTGVVTALSEGSATITATSEGRSGTAAVSVTPAPVATVSVNPSTASMSVGGSVNLDATTRDASGNVLTGRAVTWSSNHPDIADVDQKGVVRGISVGTATITATSEGKSGTASVTVTPPPVASVVVEPQPATVKTGSGVTLTATCRDANGDTVAGVPVGWAMSTSSSIATFLPTSDVAIRVIAKKKGTARFTATCGTKSAQASVVIND